ncbi:MAG: 3-deoxy-D-manno-octulosonic acid transferase [Bacteroidales bacterium]|nr:3-deoxy-D-manno-octulosonic acid transferase [Bacteroidales bacterium]
MMRTLYSYAIGCYATSVRIAAPFNVKARQMSIGWKKWEQHFPKEILKDSKVAWFHASSLGEFEQARPVIEVFRDRHPEYKICLTFFSPSGYEIRKDYTKADIVCYLPPDTRHNAKRLIAMMHPDIAFFVKYDFWFNYLHQLHLRNIPTYIFSAIFRKSQYFFKPYGLWFARQLNCYNHLFVQNEESMDLLHSIGIERCSIAGDTRFDRVRDIASHAKHYPIVEAFLGNGQTPVLMAGSSWEPDEENIKQFVDSYAKPLKLILAPHMIGENHLKHIERLFGEANCIRYSSISEGDSSIENRKVLIIDNIGMLSSLYRYATIAYIGGGFGKGIHNILEAAVFGCPVCFGPNYQKFQEANNLIATGGAMSYSDASTLNEILREWLDNEESYCRARAACNKYISENLGATKKIIDKTEEK